MKKRIKLGMIGGGKDSFIGPVHRMAARMSNQFDLVSGVFSSDQDRSKAYSAKLGIQPERAYTDWKTLIQQESLRDDGICVLAILTPNDSHFPIIKASLEARIHVICEKPLCNTLHDAKLLKDIVDSSDNIFCITYNYSAYPMVKHAREMVRTGAIGEIRQVQLSYVQGNLAKYNKSENDSWRLTKKGGPSLVLGDIAVHAFHLGEYVTGITVSEIMAEVGPTVPQRTVDDSANCLLRFANGAKGSLWVTNAAAGAEHGLGFKIFGSEGGLEWSQEIPNSLRHRRIDDFEQILTRRKDGKLSHAAEQAMELEFGHPEGYHDAFSTLYKETASAIQQYNNGQVIDLPDGFPSINAGLRGLVFVEACLESNQKQTWVSLNKFLNN